MWRRIGGVILVLGTCVSMPGVARSQQAPEPLPPMAPMLPLTPATTQSSGDDAGKYFRPIGGMNTGVPLLPYDYNNPTPDGTSPPVVPSQVFIPRENTYLRQRPGRLARSADGKAWEFTVDPLMENAVAMPVLTVLPSRELESLEKALKGAQEGRFAVSGTITSYNLQIFLLISVAAPADGPATLAADKAAPAPVAAPATRPATPLPPDQLLNQMLRPDGQRPPSRPLQSASAPARDLTSGSSAVAPSASMLTVMREGTFLVDRTGRLTRTADGLSWEFTFDSDSRAMKDPPVIILPNLKLMTMEQASKSSNRDLRFRITGMLTEYSGRNYVLLEKFSVVPDVTQQF